nr:PRC-barrel domain-containing protein [uncultured Cohaesibacter sp.]
MKHILATTAVALMLSTSAYAQDKTADFKTYQPQEMSDVYASNFIGMRIYSAEKDYDSFGPDSVVSKGAEQEWDDIGEINDVVLSRDGEVKGVILGVGGFLGIGEKDVVVDMDSIKFVKEQDDEGDFFLVVNADKAALMDAPNYERKIDKMMQSAKETTNSMTESAKTMVVDSMNAVSDESEPHQEVWKAMTVTELSADDLTGARVYSSKDEDIGEIDKLTLTADGQLDKAVLDIGGFLGIGEHRIAVSMDDLKIMRNDDGDLKVYISATQKELESLPAYEGE